MEKGEKVLKQLVLSESYTILLYSASFVIFTKNYIAWLGHICWWH